MSRRPLEVILLGTPQFQAVRRTPTSPTSRKLLGDPSCALSQVSRYEAVWSGLAPRVLSTNPRRQQLRTALQSQHPPAGRLAGGRPFKSPGSFAWPRPLSDTTGAGGPVPPAPGSLFLSSPEPGLRSSNWDSEPGLFLALARLQEGVSSRPLRWLFKKIYLSFN